MGNDRQLKYAELTILIEEIERILIVLQRLQQSLDIVYNKLISVRRKKIFLEMDLESLILSSYSSLSGILEQVRFFIQNFLDDTYSSAEDTSSVFIQEITKRIRELIARDMKLIEKRLKQLSKVYSLLFSRSFLSEVLHQGEYILFLINHSENYYLITNRNIYVFNNSKLRKRVSLESIISVDERKGILFSGTLIRTKDECIRIPQIGLKERIIHMLSQDMSENFFQRKLIYFIAERNALRPNFNAVRREFLRLKRKLLNLEVRREEKESNDFNAHKEAIQNIGQIEVDNLIFSDDHYRKSKLKVLGSLLKELEAARQAGIIDATTYFKLKERFLTRFEEIKNSIQGNEKNTMNSFKTS